jgi:hypothetical protein
VCELASFGKTGWRLGLTRLEKPGGRPPEIEVRSAESAFIASMSGPRRELFIEGGRRDCDVSKVGVERAKVEGWSDDKVVAAAAEEAREPKARRREPEGGLNWDGIGDLMVEADCLSC